MGQAILIRANKSPVGTYWDTYYFQCIDCGKEYTSSTHTSRTSPYCYTCRIVRRKEKAKLAKVEKAKHIRNEVIDEFVRELQAELDKKADEPSYYHTDEDFYVGICSVSSLVDKVACNLKEDK